MSKRKNKDIRETIHRFPLRQPSNLKKLLPESGADETLVTPMVGVGPAGTCGDLVTYRRERLHAAGWYCAGASALLPCLVYRMESCLLLMTSPRDVSGGHVAGRRAGLLKDMEPAPSVTALERLSLIHCGGFCSFVLLQIPPLGRRQTKTKASTFRVRRSDPERRN